jgi:(p)ppGpp synthase/HD superfamily hydrolase
MASLETAIAIAAEAHKGQRDKGGQPYILHPLRVMMKLKTENERIVAVLHDVLEDTPITEDDLRQRGFSSAIIEALRCLTREADEPYEAFIRRVKRNPLASAVKVHDMTDNMDLSRIPAPKDEDFKRVEKYRAALLILLDR